MSTTMQFRLLDLPNELVVHIVEYVGSLATLRRLACLSRRMQELVEPVLYHRLFVSDARKAKAILSAFKARPQRALAVQVLDVPANPSFGADIQKVETLLARAKTLKELMIESPLVNSLRESGFENEGVWMVMTDHLFRPFQAAIVGSEPSSRPLQKLRSLTLHLNGCLSPYWTLDHRSLDIFKHPTLHKIHVSCMNLDFEVFSPVKESFFTPLKHLILEECNITVLGLQGLLKLPKALEILYLGENCYNLRQFPSGISVNANMLFSTAPDTAIAALRSQAHSLQSLTYATNFDIFFRSRFFQGARQIREVGVADGGFASFRALEKVHLIGDCRNFERALLSTRSPPNLREIVVEGETESWLHIFEGHDQRVTKEALFRYMSFLRVPSPSIPELLTSMVFICGDREISSYRTSAGTLKQTILEAERLSKDTFGISLSVKHKQPERFYPPYLYGEPRPREGLVYDGLTGAFSEEFERKFGTTQLATARTRFLEDDPDYEPSDEDEDGPWPVV